MRTFSYIRGGRYPCPYTVTISQQLARRTRWTMYEKAVAAEYEITIGPRLGPGPSDGKEARSVNSVISLHEHHIEYEADPRQAEKPIDECGLDAQNINPMATPGIKCNF